MTKTQLLQILSDIGACPAAMKWVRDTPGTPKELYQKCRNRIWLEFVVERLYSSFDWYEYRKASGEDWKEYYCRFNLKACNIIRKMVPWAKLKKALEK
jgi:hypothetical protein